MPEPFPSAAPPIVEVHRVTRQFGNKTALDDLSLSVPRGGVFGLIGGNGAGKTTLIKHILGMLKAQSGSVRVFGLDPVENPVGTLGWMAIPRTVIDERFDGLTPTPSAWARTPLA